MNLKKYKNDFFRGREGGWVEYLLSFYNIE